MLAVFWAQWRKERRSPLLVLIFLILSIAATFMFGMTTNSKMKIDVFSDNVLTKAEETHWLELLNQGEAYDFKMRDEQPARKAVREGRADVAIKLMSEDYRIIAAIDGPNVGFVDQHVRGVFEKERKLRDIAERSDAQDKFRKEVDRELRHPALTLQTQSLDGRNIVKYDMNLHYLFGFTLFLVIFTISFKVSAVTVEKSTGVWNRVILSPVRKTELYLGHLL